MVTLSNDNGTYTKCISRQHCVRNITILLLNIIFFLNTKKTQDDILLCVVK